METTQSRYARRYDREFKENAVALEESRKEIKEVARYLGRVLPILEGKMAGLFQEN